MACFADINVTQDSVATPEKHLQGAAGFLICLTANLPKYLPVIFFKLVKI